ncbi:MAG: hypothetical protein LUK37_20410 [Clostridia bacterium]|nr:hypothetical protein [Clostridia bacterium]
MKKTKEYLISSILFAIGAVIWFITIPMDYGYRGILDTLFVLHCCCALLFGLASIAFLFDLDVIIIIRKTAAFKIGDNMKKLLIWGAGDQGTVTLSCAMAMNEYEQIDFLDFKEKGHREIPGFTIYEEEKEDLHHFFKKYDEVIVATGENNLREKKVLQLIDMNIQLATMIHPTATISSYAKIS